MLVVSQNRQYCSTVIMVPLFAEMNCVAPRTQHTLHIVKRFSNLSSSTTYFWCCGDAP
ncbi:hypothetical protein KUCAC02_023415, partial [Chaenocephalus aceratus]